MPEADQIFIPFVANLPPSIHLGLASLWQIAASDQRHRQRPSFFRITSGNQTTLPPSNLSMRRASRASRQKAGIAAQMKRRTMSPMVPARQRVPNATRSTSQRRMAARAPCSSPTRKRLPQQACFPKPSSGPHRARSQCKRPSDATPVPRTVASQSHHRRRVPFRCPSRPRHRHSV